MIRNPSLRRRTATDRLVFIVDFHSKVMQTHARFNKMKNDDHRCWLLMPLSVMDVRVAEVKKRWEVRFLKGDAVPLTEEKIATAVTDDFLLWYFTPRALRLLKIATRQSDVAHRPWKNFGAPKYCLTSTDQDLKAASS
jgi:hypothetical protein